MTARGSAGDATQGQPERVTYEQLLDMLAETTGSLGEELSSRERRRSVHLLHLLTHGRVVFDGLQQVREGFLWLARMPVPTTVADLTTDAADRIVTGVEAILQEAAPRVLDESRYLMELEFLFYDFARDLVALVEWENLDDRRRNQRSVSGRPGTGKNKHVALGPIRSSEHATNTACTVPPSIPDHATLPPHPRPTRSPVSCTTSSISFNTA